MVYEYAIDPYICHNFGNFKLIWDNVGPEKGRLISLYPENWKSKAKESISDLLPPLRKRIIKEILTLRRYKKRYCPRSNTVYDEGDNWLNNAIHEHGRSEFHGIVIKDDPGSCPCPISIEDILDDNSENLWCACNPYTTIERRSSKLIEILEPLFKISNTLKLIDPYIDLSNPKFKRPIKAMIINFIESTPCLSKRMIELHSKVKEEPNQNVISDVKNNFDNFLEEINNHLDDSTNIEFFLWNNIAGKERFQDRYIISNITAIDIKHGLDDDGNAGGQTWKLINLGTNQIIESQLNNGEFDLIWTSKKS